MHYLRVPSPHDVGLLQFESPPHRKDTIEKIKMRARSQSWLIRTRHLIPESQTPNPMIAKWMYVLSVIAVIISLPLSLLFCFRVTKEYERAVVFRLGRLIPGGIKGPGIFFILPCIDTIKVVDLRTLSFDVPSQEILSRDSVTVSVEAVIFFRISNPVISVTNVNDAQFSTKLLAQTTLRNVLGTKTLSEMLSERDSIAAVTEKVLEEGTDPWGVRVERVEIKDIRLHANLTKAMAAEAEASRNAKAFMALADGERNAAPFLIEAADVMSGNRTSLQLRYLQTLTRISTQNNHTVVLPLPVEIFRNLMSKWSGKKTK